MASVVDGTIGFECSMMNAFGRRRARSQTSSVARSLPVRELEDQLLLPSFEAVEQVETTQISQNGLGKGMDWIFGVVFGMLHIFDHTGIEDSSKNLRVLWARAALDAAGEINDPVAKEWLPAMTRGIASWPVWRPAVSAFGEFVTARTRFIDARVDNFLARHSQREPRIVLVGAGYDTRSLRYAGLAEFVEIDIATVVEGKRRLWRDRREQPPVLVPCDLNVDSLAEALLSVGVSREDQRPLLFVVECVLFYVDNEPTHRVMDAILSYGVDAELCLVDSLKPLVTSPFEHDVARFLERRGWYLHDHDSRWGGAVHLIGASRVRPTSAPPPSFFPIASAGAARSWRQPSFDSAWYAVAYSWQISATAGPVSRDGVPPFATRLFGEPLVLYRDSSGKLVCVADACPHRAAPLSMGRVKDGQLACFYHGWRFGADGGRTDSGAMCRCHTYPVEEREGIAYVWRAAAQTEDRPDPNLLPRSATRHVSAHHTVDTVLDYEVPFEYIVENNLDSYHLFWLHDGSIPPIAGLGMTRPNIQKHHTVSFRDSTGIGHVGRVLGLKSGRPNNIVRFDAPNVVRHGGANYHEEFHMIPVSPCRTRVLLRQHLPKGPILSTLLRLPGARRAVQSLVRNWNYHISLEDYSVMVGQATTVDTRGAPRLNRAGPGDDLIAKFYQWRDRALANDGHAPYFAGWSPKSASHRGDPGAWTHERATTGFQLEDNAKERNVRFFGIRETFDAYQPVAAFPPANPSAYLPLWRTHSAAMMLFGNPHFYSPIAAAPPISSASTSAVPPDARNLTAAAVV